MTKDNVNADPKEALDLRLQPQNSSSLVFYGAGKFAAANFDEIVSMGLSPVCFADKDEKKHYTMFCGLEILPISEALQRYPDCMFVLTVGVEWIDTVSRDLMSRGISPERIKYPYPVKYLRGCKYIDSSFTTSGNRSYFLSSCCVSHYHEPIAPYGETVKTYLQKYRDFRDSILHEAKSAKCYGCENFEYNWRLLKPKIKSIVCNSNFLGDVCNLKCLDCTADDVLKTKIQNTLTLPAFLRDFEAEYTGIQGIEIDNEGLEFWICNGEPLLSPHFSELLNFFKTTELKIRNIIFFTNATIYNEELIEYASKNRNNTEFLIDLSSGTPETHQKIKGVSLFHKVLENTRRYSLCGAAFRLKYIIFPDINDVEADFEGFLSFAEEIKASVHISFNYLEHGMLNSETTTKIRQFICLLKSKNLNYIVDSYNFKREDAASIKEHIV